MKVVVPFAEREQSWSLQAAGLALVQDGIEVEYAPMLHDESYYLLLSRQWSEQKTFAIIEHDIVIWPGALAELEQCEREWCTRPYYCSLGWIQTGLGCTVFRASLIQAHPDFFAMPFPTCCNHSTHYCGLDRLIAHRMEELNIDVHVHEPGVTNLNPKWTI